MSFLGPYEVVLTANPGGDLHKLVRLLALSFRTMCDVCTDVDNDGSCQVIDYDRMLVMDAGALYCSVL